MLAIIFKIKNSVRIKPGALNLFLEVPPESFPLDYTVPGLVLLN
jgi:hypothetical protein